MTSKTAGLAGLAAAAAVAGCGGSSGPSESAFKAAWTTQSANLTALGTEARTTISAADGKTNRELVTQFTALAAKVRVENASLRGLQAPAKYKKDLSALTSSFDRVGSDLTAIANAAQSGNAKAARAATQTLIADSAPVKATHNSISAMAGTPISP